MDDEPDATTLAGLESVLREIRNLGPLRWHSDRKYLGRIEDLRDLARQAPGFHELAFCLDKGTVYHVTPEDVRNAIECLSRFTGRNLDLVGLMTLTEAVEELTGRNPSRRDPAEELPRVDPESGRTWWGPNLLVLDPPEAAFLYELVEAKGEYVAFSTMRERHPITLAAGHQTRIKKLLLERFPDRIESDGVKGFRWVVSRS